MGYVFLSISTDDLLKKQISSSNTTSRTSEHGPGDKFYLHLPKISVIFTIEFDNSWFMVDSAQNKQQVVRESLMELQNDVGCIKFMESRNTHYVDVHSQHGRGCFAMIGLTGGQNQFLNLDESQMCLGNKGVIKHEFIHALGFMHTHMRRDRDNFIRINWNAIMSNRMSFVEMFSYLN